MKTRVKESILTQDEIDSLLQEAPAPTMSPDTVGGDLMAEFERAEAERKKATRPPKPPPQVRILMRSRTSEYGWVACRACGLRQEPALILYGGGRRAVPFVDCKKCGWRSTDG